MRPYGHTICENLKFLTYFLNKDVAFDISKICMEFSTHVDDSHLEESVSQNFDLGNILILCNLEKKVLKNDKKLSPYSTENCVCVGYQTQMKLTQTT